MDLEFTLTDLKEEKILRSKILVIREIIVEFMKNEMQSEKSLKYEELIYYCKIVERDIS